MKLPGYYSSGEFAHKAHITKKTLRYYDEHNIFKPSYVTDKGARFYNDNDFAKLQQIQFFKYLGFSLDDIKEMTLREVDSKTILDSFHMQMGLIEERMEQLELMKSALKDASDIIERGADADWSHMLDLVNMNEMEQKLKKQYKDASNISARINPHRDYSLNPVSWFEWIFNQCAFESGYSVLELGCGDASLWSRNVERIPANMDILLTDISYGMIRDAVRNLSDNGSQFRYEVMDAHQIYKLDDSFDRIIANHVLFYCEDIPQVLAECRRVLKNGGRFLCSTYGKQHMWEITDLVQQFHKEIVLSAEVLYERFGLENGENLLAPYFPEIQMRRYEDAIEIAEAEPLISYILSCHGNQNQLLLNQYKEFREFVSARVADGFHITKDAGIFLCRK